MTRGTHCAVLLATAAVLLSCSEVLRAQVPHLVYGEVRASDGSVPAASQVTFEAFIQNRPGEMLTDSAPGQTGLLPETSPLIWMVQCADFPTPWSIGDLLVVNVRSQLTGESASAEVLLTSDPYQDAGILPLPLHLVLLEAAWQDEGVLVRWQTTDEVDCMGFDLWRAEQGKQGWVRLNASLLPAVGGIGRRQEYRYLDQEAPRRTRCHYRLEEVARNGVRTVLGTVSVETPGLLPTAFRLSPAFPNPCRGATRISLSLARESSARVAIVDLRGALVKVLAEGSLPPGEHGLTWDGKDQHGRELPAGIYFCRVTAGGEHRVEKIVLTR
ncbi:MAG: FlgD immunoglobulin-like domain containing protein [bacterium]|jgi:hypothetical protein|nr:T9SS type A sorting domain-containing protein [candidate division KSB1 bacterium]MDH7558967.1 FlgD immunoglobulin-like domain containing protein [bacterium]